MNFLDARSGRPDTIVLFKTHVFDEQVVSEYARLATECRGRFDVRLLYDATGDYPGRHPSRAPGAVGFDFQEIRKTLPLHFQDPEIPDVGVGNQDLPALYFHAEDPGYEYYWIIEFDVRFTGSWCRLLDHFRPSGADLLATTVFRQTDSPDWVWWRSLSPPAGAGVRDGEGIHAFLPIFRLSNRALARLRGAYLAGWRGHQEATVGTVLHSGGMTVEDLGGEGEFVKPENRGRFYSNQPYSETLSPGTLVWRPIRVRPGRRRDMLWHPVKAPGSRLLRYDGSETRARAVAGRPPGRGGMAPYFLRALRSVCRRLGPPLRSGRHVPGSTQEEVGRLLPPRFRRSA